MHDVKSKELNFKRVDIFTEIKTQDILRVITSLKSEMERMRQEEERLNYESDLGVVVLFLIQGRKLDEGQKSEIKRLLNEFSTQFGGTFFIIQTII